MTITIEQLIDISKEAGQLPWELLGMQDPDYSLEVIASDVYEVYRGLDSDSQETRELILLATIINLTAENFILNAQIGLMD
jgi:hypothetical protein